MTAAALRGSRGSVIILGFLSGGWTIAVFTIWCVGVLVFFSNKATDSTALPFMLWAYGVATAPIGYMAAMESRGGGGQGAMVYTLMAQLATVICAIGILLGNNHGESIAMIFAGIMSIAFVVQLAVIAQSDLT